MGSPAEDFVELLQDSSSGIGGGLGSTTGWTVAVGGLPDGTGVPHTAISFTESSGSPPSGMVNWYESTVQCLVRGSRNGRQAAYNKAWDIMTHLHAMTDVTLNDCRYIVIRAMTDVFFVGYDEKNRPVFGVNFIAKRTLNDL